MVSRLFGNSDTLFCDHASLESRPENVCLCERVFIAYNVINSKVVAPRMFCMPRVRLSSVQYTDIQTVQSNRLVGLLASLSNAGL